VGWSKSPSAGSLVQEQLHSVAFCYGIVSKSCLQANNPTLPSRGQGRREIQPEIARATGLDRKTIPSHHQRTAADFRGPASGKTQFIVLPVTFPWSGAAQSSFMCAAAQTAAVHSWLNRR